MSRQTAWAALPATGRLRVVLRVAGLAALLSVCVAGYALWRPFARHNPWPRWCFRGINRIAGIRARIVGAVNRRGAFLLANHVSWIDIPAIASASGAAFVGHDGLAGHPVMRKLCELNDTVFIARHDRASVTRQIDQVRAAIRDTGALAVFPEGTCGDGVSLLPFKSSLLSALDPVPEGISVQPVWLDYGAEVPEWAWVGDEHGIDNFVRVLARERPLGVTVHFLPPLSGEALASRKTMAAAARDAIERAMIARS